MTYLYPRLKAFSRLAPARNMLTPQTHWLCWTPRYVVLVGLTTSAFSVGRRSRPENRTSNCERQVLSAYQGMHTRADKLIRNPFYYLGEPWALGVGVPDYRHQRQQVISLRQDIHLRMARLRALDLGREVSVGLRGRVKHRGLGHDRFEWLGTIEG